MEPNKNEHREKITLTARIAQLINMLEKHQKTHTFSNVLLVIATVLLVGVTYMLVHSTDLLRKLQESDSNSRMKVEALRQTNTLCENFSNWYINDKDMPNDPALMQLHSWMDNDSSWKSHQSSDSSKWISILEKNFAVHRFFNFFESAKELNRVGLLNNDYFNNWFMSQFERKDSVKSPTIDQYVSKTRKDYTDITIWDGYYYCDTTIVLKHHSTPEEGSTTGASP